jgi:hypothetical protein
MKGYLLILAILIGFGVSAQIEAPKVKRIQSSEAIFQGMIDTQSVEFYLVQVSGSSRFQDYAHLEGWYRFYGADTSKTPVMGIESGGELLLFSGAEYWDTLYGIIDRGEAVYYEEAPLDVWGILSNPDFNQFEERFCLQGGDRYWQNGEEKRPFQVDFNGAKLRVYEEYLDFKYRSDLNLLELGMYHKGFEVLAWSDGEVLLSYFYDSNPWNPMGRCGAGFESGLCRIWFDVDGGYQGHETYWLESCNSGYYAELELEEEQLNMKIFDGEVQDSVQLNLGIYQQAPAAILDSIRNITY